MTASFVPDEELLNATTYFVEITTDATDLEGSPLEMTFAWSFTTVGSGFQANSTFTNLAGQSVTGFGDQAWGNTTPINLMGLTSGNGNYTLEVFFRATTNEGERFSNNGGSNFKANFTVVPEPSSAALGLLGAAFMLRRRR
jgi:hypothetical protein